MSEIDERNFPPGTEPADDAPTAPTLPERPSWATEDDGDHVAALIRLAGVHEGGREIALRFATFTRFRGDLAVEVYTILDVLGVVEQMIGRPLDIPLVPVTPELVEV